MSRTDSSPAPGAPPFVAPEGSFLRWLEINARLFPDKPAIISIDQHDKTITHGAFYRLAVRIGHDLNRRGFRANDRVALLSNNSIEHIATYLGVMAYGATACTIHVEMNQVYFEEILASVRPKLVVYESGLGVESYAKKVASDWLPLGEWRSDGSSTGWMGEVAAVADAPALAPVNTRTDNASIFYTSGTASKPKGVVLTFAELYDNVEPTADAFGIGPNDRILDFRSYNWLSAQGLSCLGTFCKGATLVMARKFSQSRYLDWIRDYRATIAAGNPTTINMMTNRPVPIKASDVPHLRFITSSSAPLTVQEWKRFEEMYGIVIAQGYGTSETGWIAGSNEKSRKFGTVGRPLAYHRLGVVDEQGRGLPAGEIGAIELGADSKIAFRYLANDGTIRVNAQGRVKTGDLGYLDADGYLHVTGRAKDLIIRGGVNIAPIEIDNIVLELAGVAEAATVGVPDPIYGEAVVVYVAVKSGSELTGETILAHCAAKLPEFKRPAEVLFKDQLPKTERGKMDRAALVAEWKMARA